MSVDNASHAEIDKRKDEPPPIPSPGRRLKRILIVAGIVLLALIGLRLVWGCEAERRLHAKIAELRAAGELILPEDFDQPTIRSEDNAAKAYERALVLLVTDSNEEYRLTDGDQIGLNTFALSGYPDAMPANMDAAARLIAANAETLRLVSAARELPACDWNLEIELQFANKSLPQLNAIRRTIMLTCATALHERLTGQHEESVERLRDALVFADRIYDPRGLLIRYLIGIRCTAFVSRAVEHRLPDLAVTDGVRTIGDAEHPAQSDQVTALIADLLDETAQNRGWQIGWNGERPYILNNLRLLCNGKCSIQVSITRPAATPPDWWEAPIRILFSPLWRLEALRMIEEATAVRDAGAAPSWPQAIALMPDVREPPAAAHRWVHFPKYLGISSGTCRHVLRQHYYGLARRRMAAIALAIRLFELDHGKPPATLVELVPDYLPAVPEDPFAPDRGPLRYLPDTDRPVLYSVGPNGTDDGGYLVKTYTEQPSSLGTGETFHYLTIDWEHTDIPFALDGHEPPEHIIGDESPTNSD